MFSSALTLFTSGLVMLACKPPSLSPLPRPLAASDGVHTFTFDSVQRRLPLIIESVLDKNEYGETLQADLRALAAEIAAGAPLKPLIAPSAEWESALAPHLEAGDTWFSAPWCRSGNRITAIFDREGHASPSLEGSRAAGGGEGRAKDDREAAGAGTTRRPGRAGSTSRGWKWV